MAEHSLYMKFLDELVTVGKDEGIDQQDLAVRVGIKPSALSRKKGTGSRDIELLDAMARQVGLKLALVPDNETLEAITKGDFF